MLRKVLLLICFAFLATLAIASKAQAWGVYHYSYRTSYGGAASYDTAYHYGYGSDAYRYGYVRRY